MGSGSTHQVEKKDQLSNGGWTAVGVEYCTPESSSCVGRSKHNSPKHLCRSMDGRDFMVPSDFPPLQMDVAPQKAWGPVKVPETHGEARLGVGRVRLRRRRNPQVTRGGFHRGSHRKPPTLRTVCSATDVPTVGASGFHSRIHWSEVVASAEAHADASC